MEDIHSISKLKLLTKTHLTIKKCKQLKVMKHKQTANAAKVKNSGFSSAKNI